MKKNKIKTIIIFYTLLPTNILASRKIICGTDKIIPYEIPDICAKALTIIKIATPILLVISGMIEFFKAITSNDADKEIDKAKSGLISKIISAVLVFIIFAIITSVVNFVSTNTTETLACAKCFINPEKCEQFDYIEEDLKPGLMTEIYDIKPTQDPGPNKEQNPNSEIKPEIEEKNGAIYIKGVLIVNKTYSLPSTYSPDGLTDETNEAYTKLAKGAAKDGIKLEIVSGYRSYASQEIIYKNYLARDKDEADTYSARPGHSEHQTGLAIDLNKSSSEFNTTKEAQWLNDNCYKYGFIIRYPKGKEKITGYQYESWHLRYVGLDLAKKLYNDGNWITIEEYFNITSSYE